MNQGHIKFSFFATNGTKGHETFSLPEMERQNTDDTDYAD
jgi:hypothetical protein